MHVDAQVVGDRQRLDSAWQRAIETLKQTIPKMGTDRPCIGQADLTYVRCDDKNWVDSFWSGQLWLAYAETGDDTFLKAAREQRPYFAERLNRPESYSHDIGFLYTLSAVADYKVTGDAEARRIGFEAAEFLAQRFNPAGRYLLAWNAQRHEGKMIIDCMENLALLFWAAKEAERADLYGIAIAHAETTATYLVRDDGSTHHTFCFDPTTGEPLGGSTFQGYADESCWSRGQAWGIHGFAQTYSYTGEQRFLETARRLADYAIAHLPDDFVPWWDYSLPEDAPRYRDSSAAVITSAGLLLLADQLEDQREADHYRTVANAILENLIDGYTTTDLPYAEGLLLHGASFVEQGKADTMLPYGDYFYLESLLRASNRKQFFW